MSSLSFLSKKSWHTGLQSNQERVWKAEKAALAERRKVDELRKERDRERELQELERLQEQAGGSKGKRQERVDWMYSAPAGGNNVDKNELEDYLLGKKRVDKLLQGDEKSSLSKQGGLAAASASAGPPNAGSSGGDATGLTGVSSDRDVASKIREDPMLAIRQQEQAAYQALLRDPVRLRAMRKAAGLPDKDAESKEDRRRRKEEKRRRRDEESSRHRDRDRDGRVSRQYEDERHREDREGRHRHRDGLDAEASSRRSRYYDDDDRERQSRHRTEGRDSRDRDFDYRSRRSEQYKDLDDRDRRTNGYDRRTEYNPPRRSERERSPYRRNGRKSRSRSPERTSYRNGRAAASSDSASDAAAAREAKLAAMQQNAVDVSSSRKAYLDKVQAEEAAELARDEALRSAAQASRGHKNGSRDNGHDGSGFGTEPKGRFLVDQERSLYGAGSGMDLAERLRRGRDGLQRFREE